MATTMIMANINLFKNAKDRSAELSLGKTIKKICIKTNEEEKNIFKTTKK